MENKSKCVNSIEIKILPDSLNLITNNKAPAIVINLFSPLYTNSL